MYGLEIKQFHDEDGRLMPIRECHKNWRVCQIAATHWKDKKWHKAAAVKELERAESKGIEDYQINIFEIVSIDCPPWEEFERVEWEDLKS